MAIYQVTETIKKEYEVCVMDKKSVGLTVLDVQKFKTQDEAVLYVEKQIESKKEKLWSTYYETREKP